MTPDDIRATALAILSADIPLTRNAGSFLGQLVAVGNRLTAPQEEWLLQLAERANVEVPHHA